MLCSTKVWQYKVGAAPKVMEVPEQYKVGGRVVVCKAAQGGQYKVGSTCRAVQGGQCKFCITW
jgi:hypothetical protein